MQLQKRNRKIRSRSDCSSCSDCNSSSDCSSCSDCSSSSDSNTTPDYSSSSSSSATLIPLATAAPGPVSLLLLLHSGDTWSNVARGCLLLATFYAFELGIYEISPRQRSKSTHNSLLPAQLMRNKGQQGKEQEQGTTKMPFIC